MGQSAPSACPSMARRAAGGVPSASEAAFRRNSPQTAMISAGHLSGHGGHSGWDGRLQCGMSPAWQHLCHRRSG